MTVGRTLVTHSKNTFISSTDSTDATTTSGVGSDDLKGEMPTFLTHDATLCSESRCDTRHPARRAHVASPSAENDHDTREDTPTGTGAPGGPERPDVLAAGGPEQFRDG